MNTTNHSPEPVSGLVDAPVAEPVTGHPDKVLYTPLEAAAALGIGRSTLCELLARGDLPSVRIGSCRRVPVAAVAAYVDRLVEASQTRGTIGTYRSSGATRDAAVDDDRDGRVPMAPAARRGRREAS